MKKILLSGAFLLAGCTSGEGGGNSCDESREARFDELAAQVEADRIALDAPGVSVAVIEDGEVVWAEGFGSRLADGDACAKASTLYRIGSVNKMMTSAALLRRVESGAIDLDDPVTMHSGGFHFTTDAGWAPSIRVRDLMTHSSGMVDYLRIDGPDDDAALESFLTQSGNANFPYLGYLMNPAGRFYNYSNPNFYVAALVTQDTTPSGALYRDIMRDEVFEPLGMDRTFFLGEDVLDDGDWASGSTLNWNTGVGGAVAEPDSYDNAWARPAGYAWSSVEDLAKFAKFLLDGDPAVLSDAMRAEMQEQQVSTGYWFDYSGYGYGLSVDTGVQTNATDWYDVKIVHHSGAINGFSALLILIPSTRTGFITLANTDGAYFGPSQVLWFEQFAGLAPPIAVPDYGIDPADFPGFAGTYEDPYNVGTLIVTTSGNGLEVSAPDLDDFGIPYDPELVPYSQDNFVFTVQGYPQIATFILGSAGNPEYFRTRAFVGAFTPGSSFASAPPPAIDPDRLEQALRSASLDGPVGPARLVQR